MAWPPEAQRQLKEQRRFDKAELRRQGVYLLLRFLDPANTLYHFLEEVHEHEDDLDMLNLDAVADRLEKIAKLFRGVECD